MQIKQKIIHFFFIFFIFLLIIIQPSTIIYALDESLIDFYAENNIFFYDPFDNSESKKDTYHIIGNNPIPNLILNQTTNSEEFKKNLQTNKPIYESLANKYKIPWQVFAALHYRNGDLNPNKSILDGSDLNSSSDLFNSGIATYEKLKKSSPDKKLGTLTTVKDWAEVFINYYHGNNSTGGIKTIEFHEASEAINGIDSSHLNMKFSNLNDEFLYGMEDPRLGGVTIMKVLGFPLESSSVNIYNKKGLTYAEAVRFMQRYSENNNDESKDHAGLWSLDNTQGSNCVTFSQFFLARFTNARYQGGNGFQVVDLLKTTDGNKNSNPSAFSVFSYGDGVSSKYSNHTGVVLGFENGEYITGEAGYYSKNKIPNCPGDGTLDGNGAGYVVKRGIDPLKWSIYVQGRINFFHPKQIKIEEIRKYINEYTPKSTCN